MLLQQPAPTIGYVVTVKHSQFFQSTISVSMIASCYLFVSTMRQKAQIRSGKIRAGITAASAILQEEMASLCKSANQKLILCTNEASKFIMIVLSKNEINWLQARALLKND